jgi:hypothetical protein
MSVGLFNPTQGSGAGLFLWKMKICVPEDSGARRVRRLLDVGLLAAKDNVGEGLAKEAERNALVPVDFARERAVVARYATILRTTVAVPISTTYKHDI